MKDFNVYQTSGMLNFLVSEASDVRKKEQTLSGDIISFTADAQTPAKIVVDIDSTGWTGCEVWSDPKYGGVIDWNQLLKVQTNPYTSNGITVSFDPDRGVYSLSGEATGSYANVFINADAVQDHVYASVLKIITNPNNINIAINLLNINWQSGYMKKSAVTRSSAVGIIGFTAGTDLTGITFNCEIYDLTQMLGATVADEVLAMETNQTGDGIAWIRNLFPEDYYEYNAGTETTVSAVNGDPYQNISVSFPVEVGTITDGTLTIDYDGSVTLKTGGQTYTLTSVSPIETYIGDNNIWADAGPVSVTYPI